MIRLKTPDEIEEIRAAGRAVAAALEAVGMAVAPGATTAELDRLAEEVIRSFNAEPAFKGQRSGSNKQPFPSTICASVNDEVVHGIPGPRRLQEGDLLSVDVGARWHGLIADAAQTFAVGAVSAEVQRLLDTCRKALERAIACVRRGERLLEISGAIEQFVTARGMSVVRDLVGHGVGRNLWEEPQVPNFRSDNFPNPVIEIGLVIAIEPMICAGRSEVRVDPNGWTVRTADGSLAAHFEHTVAVTENGAAILTLS